MSMNPRLLRPTASGFSPRSISGLALWLDAADPGVLYTTDAGPVTAVTSPLDIAGCALWLDGADSSAASMTLNGSLVEAWKDKSNSGNNVTASGGLRPTLTGNALNSRSVVTFGGSQGLTGNLAASISSNAYSVFVVCRISGAITNGRVLSTAGAGNDFASGGVIPCVSNGVTLSAFAGTQGTNASGVTGFASYGVFAGVLSSNLVTNSAGGMSVASAAATLSTAVTRLGVGVAAQGGTGFNTCDIAEIILYPTALSTADRARVEAYLATKWGISGVHAPATASSDPVGFWADKSGNGRHAVRSIGSRRPSVSATAQNGKKTIAFTGASFTGMTAPGGQSMKDGATFCGAYFSGDVNFSMLMNVGETAGGKRWDIGSAFARVNLSYYLGSLNPQASMGNVTCILTGVFNKASNTVTLRMNGAQIATGTASPVLASYASDVIGIGMNNGDSEQHLNGRVFELAAYNQPLLPAQARRLEQYLAARWGITLAPQVANADAQDWINRVYANGGTVSTATAQAVDTFCGAIQNAGIRDRFRRLNLFCGTGLNACLTPLYRAASLGDTQLGNATDTNVGPFVSGDFADTTGLAAGSGKYLRTGLTQTSVGLACHLAYYDCVRPTNAYANRIGSRGAGDANEHAITNIDVATTVDYGSSATSGTGRARATGYTQAGAFWLGVNPSATSAILYKNGVSAATATPSARTAQSVEYWLFALNNNGSIDSPMTTGRAGGYSIGSSMDATQAAAYNTAIQAFQTSLLRNA